MKSDVYLKKLHLELLDIIKEVDRVCSENNITYYLAEGTLLGAVRHNGFIPWDDDIDISMTRNDFEKFIRIAPEALDKRYELRWITTQENYWQVFAKVSVKHTLFKEPGLIKFPPNGIFIDIFPLDYSGPYSASHERKKRRMSHINSIIWSKNSDGHSFRHIVLRTLSSIFTTQQLHKLMSQVIRYRKGVYSHLVNYGSIYGPSKETFPIEWYGSGVRMAFEHINLIVPKEYLKILEAIYGPNFMQIPPIEKRRCHYPEKVIFSDGEEITFNRSPHFDTIKDQELNHK